MKLKDPLLLRQLCFIDGAWAPADNGGTLDVHNPATAEKLGLIPNMGASECRRAIAAAAAALPAWAARTAKDRAGALRRDGIGGILVKLVKPGQDKRADLPTIGPDTVRNAAAAGLRGLAFEGNATILAEREACLAVADAVGLFLLGLDPVTLKGDIQ